MLAASKDADWLKESISELPKEVQLKAADVMRLSTSYGPNGGVLKAEQFLNSLSPSEFSTFQKWWRDLSRGDQDAILGAISKCNL